jgi:hypothetical protein
MLRISFVPEIESCANCQRRRKPGIVVTDARRSRVETSYIDICIDCFPRWIALFNKARAEFALWRDRQIAATTDQ